MTTEVVVLVPGTMGSELFDGRKCVWPGSVLELFLPYSHMASLRKPALRVGDIIRNVSISTQYADLVQALGRCGFREGSTPKTLYVFPYDWRKDNALAAALLADLLDTVEANSGAGVDVNLVAHSMGGLVARCYLESGTYSGRKGFKSVRRLITLATPHRGAPVAMSGALGREKHLFLSGAQTRELSSDPQFPALYQLMPPRGEPFVWNQDPNARLAPLDPYDAAIAAKLGLSVQNLQAAEKFHRLLDVSRKPQGIGYFFFVGTQQQTMTEFRVKIAAAGGVSDLFSVEREDGGDGTVPSWSAGQSPIQSAAVGGDHGTIYKARGLLQVLATLLGQDGALAALTLPPAELFVRDRVVETGQETARSCRSRRPRPRSKASCASRGESAATATGLPLPPPRRRSRSPTRERRSIASASSSWRPRSRARTRWNS
jgi:pimeloyl-ACP methyl ester carboxylesterase